MIQKLGCSVLLRERIKSLKQQIAVLQKAKRTAVSSVKEFKEANEKLTSQLHLADQRLQTSRRTIQVTLVKCNRKITLPKYDSQIHPLYNSMELGQNLIYDLTLLWPIF